MRKSGSTAKEQIQITDNLEQNEEKLDCNDIYSELYLRGLQYSGSFRSIHQANVTGSKGFLIPQKEWITFVEGMLQMYIFGNNLKTTQVPLKVIKIIVDMKHYEKESQKSKSKRLIFNNIILKFICEH